MSTITRNHPPVRRIHLPPSQRGNGWWNGDEDPESLALPSWQLGTWFGIGALTVLFAALSSAYVVRVGGERLTFALPPTLWVGLIVLAANSATLIQTRRLLQARDQRFRHWLKGSFVLGCVFLFVQLITWQMLSAQGLFLTTNPHSSFFYVLSFVHAAHVLGGLAALVRCMHHINNRSLYRRLLRAVGMTATYWHFVDVVWVWIVVLFIWTSL